MALDTKTPSKPTGKNAGKGPTPNDVFKQALSGCMRAVSGEELEVTFANDRPSMSGDTARLPEPARKMTAREIATTRGLADSMALRRACHDTSVHRKNTPQGQMGQAIFDAVEQALSLIHI